MFYVFEMLYKDNLYFMHDLSCNWVCNEILYFENFMSLEMMLNWKVFYIVLICKAYFGNR